MTTLHVVADARGQWRVVDEQESAPLSEHTTATDAERAAWRHARVRGAGAVLVHDRYGRTHHALPFTVPADRGAYQREAEPVHH